VRIILASASPRRAELLASAGIPFEVRPADVDESARAGEAPEAYVRRLAEEKGSVVRTRIPGRPVLAADTVVVAAGEMLGKPRDPDDACRMLRALSGARHTVMTGVCLVRPRVLVTPGTTCTDVRPRPDVTPDAGLDVRVAVTAVEFAPLTDSEIAWYVATGEPMDKAGAYAVQGLASRFVTRLEGSYSNVVGLPVALVYEMCSDAGILLS
jgi:septum formation protein